ncbi:MAG: FAD-dependent oxidoreductase, partial [Candidatus Eremiobacteraeota bacterium]|nr:FAD-dependent oxidoreductase [Candidatus Eremiobacteraeota bacterium]
LAQLAQMFPHEHPAEHVQAVYHYDWQADPFACGAYSYLRTGGDDARERLGKPHRNLIFAGEATATGGQSGTVGGALRAGYGAARVILE